MIESRVDALGIIAAEFPAARTVARIWSVLTNLGGARQEFRMLEIKTKTTRLEIIGPVSREAPQILIVCSECNGAFNWWAGEDVVPPSYCPHCGALVETV
jgi:hypothetical protein